jgi:two-component system response regulator AtoC
MREDNRIKVLIAEDEANLGSILQQFLEGRGYQVAVYNDGRSALDALRAESFDVALLDIVMPEMDGLEVLRQIREELSPPEVIIITGNGTIETAISAMKLGAYDYLAKPYRMAEIDVMVRRAWEKRELTRENALLHKRLSRAEAVSEIVTQFAPMQAVLALVERVARSDSAVLILGESGTGKELIARMLHRLSHRSSGPLVDINCAAIPDALVESELFGHERGAHAEASTRKLGLFELANGGTIFMDEIGALDPKVQGKLLRALELGTFYRVGGTQKVRSDLRVVAASNQDLAQRVANGTFRSDLYYRINTISITLPPLRERSVDNPLLARPFLAPAPDGESRSLSPDAIDALQAYPWPGNVRELRNVIERAALVATGTVLHASDVPLGALPTSNGGRTTDPLAPLEQVERQHIETVLQHARWHQGKAADILGISPKTLYRKIREFGLRRPNER